MAKQLTNAKILIESSDGTDNFDIITIFYEAADSVDANLKKSIMKTISLDVGQQSIANTLINLAISTAKTDEGIS
jgi:hypothetical protein